MSAPLQVSVRAIFLWASVCTLAGVAAGAGVVLLAQSPHRADPQPVRDIVTTAINGFAAPLQTALSDCHQDNQFLLKFAQVEEGKDEILMASQSLLTGSQMKPLDPHNIAGAPPGVTAAQQVTGGGSKTQKKKGAPKPPLNNK